MKEKLPENGRATVGFIGVDAGICWLGDPCYILKDKGEARPKDLGKNWSEFCDRLGNEKAVQFHYDAGHEGLGVVVSTGYGDGMYPVVVTMKEGRVQKVEIKFF